MERRAHVRKPLTLDAKLISRGAGEHACQIRDFCLGGVFIACGNGAQALPRVGRNDSVFIEVRLRSAGVARPFRLAARVAGLFSGGLGLAFINPDPQALTGLNALASDAQHGAARSAGEGQGITREGKQILRELRALTEEFLKAGFTRFYDQAKELLFASSRQARSNSDETRYFDALKELDGIRTPLETSFLGGVLEGLERLGKKSRNADQAEEPAFSELALVDTMNFDDWLAMKNIVMRTQPKHAALEYDLNARLSALARAPIDDESNPVSTSGICDAFQEAIQNLGASRTAREAVFTAFQEKIVAALPELLTALNERLRERGVLPTVEHPTPTVPRVPRRTPDEAEPAAAATQAAQPPAAPAPAPGPPLGPAPGAPGFATSAQSGGPGGQAAAIGAAAVIPTLSGMPGGFGTAMSLLGLQRDVQAATGGPHARADGNGAFFARAEVAAALAGLQAGSTAPAWDETTRTDLKGRLLEVLAERYPDAAHRGLHEADRDALDLIESFLNSVLRDRVLSEAIKQRIRRLAIPMLHVALEDGRFFTDPKHPAREVINQLGRLDLHLDPEEDRRSGVLGETVDPLIEGLVLDPARAPEVFAELHAAVERFIGAQAERYEANAREVVRACEEQQALVRQRRSPEQQPAARDAKTVPEEWRHWLDRVARLEVGDWMIMLDRPGRPRRETLAWIGEDDHAYVFVNTRGEKVDTRTPQEVAMQLRRGTAAALEHSEVPLVDRGFFAMLQSFHRRLAEEAIRDPLTGLLNYQEIERRTEQALLSGATAHVLSHLALDRFDELLAAGGRPAGDKLLREIAKVLAKHVGDDGAVARVDESDFAVLLGCDAEAGMRIAERQRNAIAQSRCMFKGEAFTLGLSIGLVDLNDPAETAAEALRAARALAGEARAAGGNRIRARGARRAAGDTSAGVAAAALGRILNGDGVPLRGQAIAPLASAAGTQQMFELLLGARDATGAPIPPRTLIAEAASQGKLVELDQAVIRSAFRWLAKHRAELLGAAGYTINLSDGALKQPALLDSVLTQFSETRIPPGKVVFEMSVAAARSATALAEGFSRVLKEFGCRFALQGLGSDPGDFSQLKNLPFDFVKIDGSYVRAMAHNPADRAVVKSINEIGHFMGRKTIAVYVEDEGALTHLREMGVDYVQGFAVARPEALAG